ncbi:MAG TPA: bifunctional chorismate mutase/prephenate dehydratase, partial [Eubacteriaceae bacterium]|nr:bifunctional chorismate mutase/prephenate dehydratase [Eubacteriaceae bacterium]
QCSRFLRDHQFQSVPTSNTAVAVQMVKEGKQTNIAALGSAFAAGLYGLKILKNDVNNYFNNITKFIILHKNKRDDKTNDKISLVFTTAHKPGALYQALGFFAQNEINLLKLISRPTRNTPWEYSYFVDIEGNQGDWKVQRALKDLKASSPHFKIFGNYRAHHLEAPN